MILVLVAVVGSVTFGFVRKRPTKAVSSSGADSVIPAVNAILQRQGLGAALDSLVLKASSDSGLLRRGHQIAHSLGRKAVAEHGGDASVIRECRPVFASGCYHGVVEGALHATGRIDMAELERLCSAAGESAQPGPGFECVHGLGHGVLGARRYDLETTLRDCDRLSSTRLAASCHAGAFMEAINFALGTPAMGHGHTHSAGDGHVEPLAIVKTDPYRPCSDYRDPYAASCWLFQGFLILRANGFDARRALQVCDGAPDGRAARCYESIGHQLTGLFQRGDRWVLDQCGKGQAALAPHCAGGATLALNAMDWSGSRAGEFCSAAPPGWKETCYHTAADALVDLASPAERAAFCSGIESEYAESCLSP